MPRKEITSETREKIRSSLKDYYQLNPDKLERLKKVGKEEGIKSSNRMKLLWQDPIFRKKQETARIAYKNTLIPSRCCIVCGHKSENMDDFVIDYRYLFNRKNLCKSCFNQGAKSRQQHLRKRQREFINAFKLKECMDCGIKYPTYVMDFDHVRGKKEFSIYRAIGRNTDVNKLVAEIEKCDIVCANCHRIRTHNRRINKYADTFL